MQPVSARISEVDQQSSSSCVSEPGNENVKTSCTFTSKSLNENYENINKMIIVYRIFTYVHIQSAFS